jgi:hypothetical protein
LPISHGLAAISSSHDLAAISWQHLLRSICFAAFTSQQLIDQTLVDLL